jgi:3-dehydroquinate dehydratase
MSDDNCTCCAKHAPAAVQWRVDLAASNRQIVAELRKVSEQLERMRSKPLVVTVNSQRLARIVNEGNNGTKARS